MPRKHVYTPRRGKSKPRAGPRSSTPLRLSDFARPRTWSFSTDRTVTAVVGPTVNAYQITKSAVATPKNPLADVLFGTSEALPWTNRELKVSNIKVHFEGRGLSPGTIFNNFTRVAAWIVPLTFAELDVAKIATNFASFSPRTMNPNGKMTINLRVGPTLDIGRYGTDTAAPATLVVATDGFSGQFRITQTVQTAGFPFSRVTLSDDPLPAQINTPAVSDMDLFLEEVDLEAHKELKTSRIGDSFSLTEELGGLSLWAAENV